MFSSNTSAVSGDAVFIEDVMSTYLYTGNGSTQTITNGIDLSTKGGLVWAKMRSNGSTTGHVLSDTARGPSQKLDTSSTGASSNWTPYGISAFGSTGFTVADDGAGNYITNNSGVNYASWTFRKQPKFFDVVTYTGNGGTPQNIAHSLGSVPGFIVVKPTSTTGGWICYHRSLTASGFNPAPYNTINLNSTGSIMEDTGAWNSTAPTSTVFTIGSSPSVNTNGATYVAYLFAHDAGGFGLTGTDNVISCGSFSTGSGGKISAPVNLGYEAQWLLAKNVDSSENWVMYDIMRGMNNTGYAALNPNTSGAEYTGTSAISPTATGFDTPNASGPFASSANYIYIAIRRGPMKVPTSGTSVFSPVARAGTSATATVTAGFPVDMTIIQDRTQNSFGTPFDRLRGATNRLFTPLTLAEASEPTSLTSFAVQTGFTLGTDLGFGAVNTSGDNYINWNFRRAPSFFDEVCYTGTGSQQNITHNLGVAPELMIVKRRSAAGGSWATWATSLTADQSLALNTTDDKTAVFSVGFWGSTYPTSSVFTVGSNVNTNSNTVTYVAYLFATCAGVSKVGSYTGTGTTLQVNCGFTGGSRFVMIKRTDSTGDWYVWDSARGIVSGNDPYLLLNSTAAEVTSTDYIDTYSAGFEISSTAPAAINASGGTFIFLAIA